MLVPQADRAAHLAHRAEYLADPRTRPMGAGMELAGRRRDGPEFPAEISLAAIETETGVLVSAAVRDGTERKQAAIVGSSRDPIISTRPARRDHQLEPGGHRRLRLRGRRGHRSAGQRLDVAGHLGRRTGRLRRCGRRPGGRRVRDRARDGRRLEVHMVCTLSPIIDAEGAVVGVSTFGATSASASRRRRNAKPWKIGSTNPSGSRVWVSWRAGWPTTSTTSCRSSSTTPASWPRSSPTTSRPGPMWRRSVWPPSEPPG